MGELSFVMRWKMSAALGFDRTCQPQGTADFTLAFLKPAVYY